MTAKTAPATAPVDPTAALRALSLAAPAARTCGCGCKANVAGRAAYRPGHDARHAGAVARAIAEAPAEADVLLAALPSVALQAKARDHAIRLLTAAAAKAAK